MDVWLLAAQMMLGTVETSELEQAQVFEGQSSAPELGGSCAASLEEVGIATLCSGSEPRMGAALAPQSPAPWPTMGAAVRWPRPDRVMTPPTPREQRLTPVTGAQLYQFRTAALQAGEIDAQVAPYRYLHRWQRAFDAPTHDQWQGLLAAEAAAMARAQGQRRLAVLVGDSLTLWLPMGDLPGDRLWLNQSISGETTAHVRQRLHYFAETRPAAIHLMVGINDLKHGRGDAEILENLGHILSQMRRQHPQAEVVVYSLLPTRRPELASDRIQRLNYQLMPLARAAGATFVDLHPSFSDNQGQLRLDLTTDGLHLNPEGYALWRSTLVKTATK